MTVTSVVLDRPEAPASVERIDDKPFERLLDAAVELRTFVAQRARQTELDRRVSAEVTQLLKEAGLYKVVQPRRFGGYEMSLESLRRLAFEVGRGCTSTGWCYGLSAAASWVLGMFPEQAQHDVWGSDSDALLASCIAPTGKAVPTDGGYRLMGRWSFGSNCDNAQWLSLGAMVEQPGGASPRPIFLLVPHGDYRIVDTWHTVGLAGTGSKDIAIETEVFVPAHRCVAFAEVLDQQAPGAEIHESALYRVPFLSGFPPLLANPAVAALRGATDEFVASIAARSTRGAFAGGGASIAQFGHVQSAVAQAEAAIDAAQLILQRDLQQATDLVNAGEKLSVEQRITLRRGHAYTVRLCVDAINGLYDVVGGTGIQLDNGVQRAWRDINAVAHHISVNWQAVSTMYGQMRFGLPPRGQY
ncbi:acyl-CoA dehydrogenase family protein [Caballeronia sp. INDeC2]|uniref:acyl-CoA dehydrogenase family protein n=1 Tax=Caballeronia sp. INDeC2 TaxID=2921747 RepID=UPI0020297037|nr:acyl-CoA dehydrogenase family protein [Caballeronia sp. INDeC2]